jgi:TolB-like protein/DNA-binding winged helix-turn-helix (wHTH) protein/Tfp pilus assembly protein PilF
MATSTRHLYEFGDWRLDPSERILLCDGEPVALTPKVFDTLVLMVESAGRLVTKDEFMGQVWADAFVGDATLAQSISQLRKALGDSEAIETVSKKGYRFLPAVRSVEAPPAGTTSQAALNGGESAESERGDDSQLTGHRLGEARWRWLVSAATLAIVAAAIFLYIYRHSLTVSAKRNIRSLAVLPLQNLSGDPNQEYFADGMTDELITDLAQIHSLRVISRTSVMQFKQTKKTLPEIASELNVDAVVEGSVLRTGNSVRVTAQLLDARQDRHLWAGSYEREIDNVLELQGQVAKTIADQVNAKLTPEEGANLAKPRPTNPEAYNALLTGRFLFNRRNAADPEKAIGYLRHATEIDPNNAEAWAALGSCYTSLGSDLGVKDPAKVLPQARAAIAKALALDPNLAGPHTTLAWIKLWYEWDWTGAEQEFRRSIELNANDSATHREYSHYLQLRKRFDEAIAENKRAIDLAPLDILPSIHLSWLYADARDGAKAVEQAKHVLEMDPSFTGAYLLLARGYELQAKWADAIASLEKAKGLYPHAYFAGLAYLYAASGKKVQAQAAMAKLTDYSRRNYVSPLDFATYYAASGERDKAFEYLDEAYRQHSTWMISLEVNDGLDNLRADPRFRELERRVGL